MASRFYQVLLFLVISVVLYGSTTGKPQKDIIQRTRTAPHRNLESSIIDGASAESGFNGAKDGLDEKKDKIGRVSVSAVAWFTLAMAAATGLGAIPFFFVELEPQWAGVCNGMAGGVMLAASFDLVQEGQTYGSGNWVVIGILSGAIFIWLCKKFLEQYGEVSMLDIKGADASKVVLVIGIMTLHSFGEGSGVGVSFAGSKGLSQGLLVTLAIAVHNIPEGLAVSIVLVSRGVSPQNAMLWSVITSLPQEASPSQVASAATLAVAFMEALSSVLQSFSLGYRSEDASGFLVSLLLGLGPLLGGIILIAFALAFPISTTTLPLSCGQCWYCFCSGSLAAPLAISVF